jgi:hypothetical protein
MAGSRKLGEPVIQNSPRIGYGMTTIQEHIGTPETTQ